jgi:hypothetical protein
MSQSVLRRLMPVAALLPALLLSCAAVSGASAADRLTVGMQLEPPVLDPGANPAVAISEVLYGSVFEGLVRFAADGSVIPQLAESWEIAADGLSYVFHLRKNVRYQDGVDFDAAASSKRSDRADCSYRLMGRIVRCVRRASLFDVEHKSVGVADVAARDRRVFFHDRTAGRQKCAFRRLHAGHEKIEHRSVLGTVFDVQPKCSRLEAQQ